MKTNDKNYPVSYVKEHLTELKDITRAALTKTQKDNGFELAGFIRVLNGFGIHKLDPQSQAEHNQIFGTGDGFGGHIYGDNDRTV